MLLHANEAPNIINTLDPTITTILNIFYRINGTWAECANIAIIALLFFSTHMYYKMTIDNYCKMEGVNQRKRSKSTLEEFVAVKRLHIHFTLATPTQGEKDFSTFVPLSQPQTCRALPRPSHLHFTNY